MLRDGDTLVIKSLDRLSRNKEHIKQELEYFKSRHIRVRVIDLPTTMLELPEGQEWVFEMINNILIEVLASIAEQERLTIRQRQAEGITAAKEKGSIWAGRHPATRQAGMRSINCGKRENHGRCRHEGTGAEAQHLLQTGQHLWGGRTVKRFF